MKQKRFYLFACIEKNIGDDLFVYIVSKRYPNINFIISSEAEYLKVNNLNNLNYSKSLRNWLYFSNKGSKYFVKRFIIAVLEKVYRIKLEKLDAIYIVGNAFKNMNYKNKHQIDWLEKRIKIANNFYLISTNYGPSNSDEWKAVCKNTFSKITDVCFRDIESYRLFDDMDNVRFARDAVLSLQVKNDNKKQKNYIIISTIDCLMSGRSDKLKKAANVYEEKMSSLVNEFNKNNIKVVLLNSNFAQDNPASERIYSNCTYKDKVSIYNYDGNLSRIFDLFNGAQAIVATRLHTIILGWLYDIPVVPIVYDIKVENLLKSYEFDGFFKNICELEELNVKTIVQEINKYSFKIPNSDLLDAHNQFKKIDEYLNRS